MAGFGKMWRQPDEQLEAIPTPESFARVVSVIASRYRLTHFDAIVELCTHYDREFDSVKPLLSPKLKLALLEEVSQKRLLKDRSFLAHKLG